MKDQLSFYRITAAQLAELPDRDFLVDRELTGYFERHGQFIDDLWLDKVFMGDFLGPMGTILGGGVDALIGRSGNLIQPSGPTIYTTHLPQGELKMIIKTLSQGRKILRGLDDNASTDHHNRLHQLATEQFGSANRLAAHIHAVQRLVERGRGKAELMSVYVRWGKG
ncbi:MAG: hypothetical protein AAFX99_11270 [Myxococcota bacterium]